MRIVVSIYSDILTWNIPDSHVQRLRAEFPQHEFRHARSARETVAAMDGAEAAFSSLIDREALAAAPGLRWIHTPAAGVGRMLGPELAARPIVLTNSRGIHAEAMAEHVIGLAIALLRSFPEAFRHQARHEWGHDAISDRGSSRLLRRSVVGIVGPGAIGTAVGRLARAFGARVEGIRRRPELGTPEGFDAVYGPGELTARLPAWDVIVLAAPLTSETRGMIGATELAAMKRDAVLINVGRGRLVKEPALVEALRAGVIGGAALDVVEHEPLDPASPLWDLPNVLITPHTSSLRSDYWDLVTDLFMENLRRFDAGEPLRNVVDKSAGY